MLDLTQYVQPRVLFFAMLVAIPLTLLGAYLYFFKAPMTEFFQLRQVRTQSLMDMEVEHREVDKSQISRLETQISHLKDRLYGKGARLSPSQMVPYVIGELDRLSQPHHVRLISVKPGAVTKVLMFEEVSFDIEVSGKYFDLFDWLKRVEIELRPMVVKQFKLKPVGNDEYLSMHLRVVSYRSSQ